MEQFKIDLINQESIIFQTLLFKEQESVENITNEDVKKLEINDDIIEKISTQVYIIGDFTKETIGLIEECAILNALDVNNPNKEVFVLPNKKFMVSYRTFKNIDKLIDEPSNVNININALKESFIKSNLLEHVKSDLQIGKLYKFDDNNAIYIILGKASKATWDTIATFASPITAFRLYKELDYKVSGYCLILENQLDLLKEIYINAPLEVIKQDLSNIFKEREQ